MLDGRTGMRDRTVGLQQSPLLIDTGKVEQSDGPSTAGCDTRVVEGVPHDAEDRSFSCRVGPTAACHGLRGLSS